MGNKLKFIYISLLMAGCSGQYQADVNTQAQTLRRDMRALISIGGVVVDRIDKVTLASLDVRLDRRSFDENLEEKYVAELLARDWRKIDHHENDDVDVFFCKHGAIAYFVKNGGTVGGREVSGIRMKYDSDTIIKCENYFVKNG